MLEPPDIAAAVRLFAPNITLPAVKVKVLLRFRLPPNVNEPVLFNVKFLNSLKPGVIFKVPDVAPENVSAALLYSGIELAATLFVLKLLVIVPEPDKVPPIVQVKMVLGFKAKTPLLTRLVTFLSPLNE